MRGQVSIEAITAFLLLLVFLAACIGALEGQKNMGQDDFGAKANAGQCALIINSVFSNTESRLKGFNANCHAEKEFEIQSRTGEKEKSSFCIAQNVKTIKNGKQTVLEVKTSEHYR